MTNKYISSVYNKDFSKIDKQKTVSSMKRLFTSLIALLAITSTVLAGEYQSFKVSIYTHAYEVAKMADEHWLDSTWLQGTLCKISREASSSPLGGRGAGEGSWRTSSSPFKGPE